MRKRNPGALFLSLFVLEVALILGYGYSEPFGDTRADILRATRAYVEHPTAQNKAAMDAKWDRFFAPDRKRNRIILVMLAANSIGLAGVAYNLIKGSKRPVSVDSA